MDQKTVNRCERFHTEVEQRLEEPLRRLGLEFKFAQDEDGCLLYFWSPRRDVRIFYRISDGDLDCEVFDRNYSHQGWRRLRQVVGHGSGMSEAELSRLYPEDFRSNEQIFREIGELLLRLPR